MSLISFSGDAPANRIDKIIVRHKKKLFWLFPYEVTTIDVDEFKKYIGELDNEVFEIKIAVDRLCNLADPSGLNEWGKPGK